MTSFCDVFWYWACVSLVAYREQVQREWGWGHTIGRQQQNCPGQGKGRPEIGYKSMASGTVLSRGGMSFLPCLQGAVSNHCLLCSDGEAPGGNPMVAGFQDDLDLDDKIPSRPVLATERVPSKNITLSSEEEEEVKDSKVTPIPDESIDTEHEKKRYETYPEVWDCAGKLGLLLSPAIDFCAALWNHGISGAHSFIFKLNLDLLELELLYAASSEGGCGTSSCCYLGVMQLYCSTLLSTVFLWSLVHFCLGMAQPFSQV